MQTLIKILLVLLTVATLGYLLPATVAYWRGKKNFLAIAVLNVFLGWTLIGWVIALVWASMHD
jgi:hypothetical protein